MLKAFKIQRDLMETQVEADVYVLAAGANSSNVAAQAGLHSRALGCHPRKGISYKRRPPEERKNLFFWTLPIMVWVGGGRPLPKFVGLQKGVYVH